MKIYVDWNKKEYYTSIQEVFDKCVLSDTKETDRVVNNYLIDSLGIELSAFRKVVIGRVHDDWMANIKNQKSDDFQQWLENFFTKDEIFHHFETFNVQNNETYCFIWDIKDFKTLKEFADYDSSFVQEYLNSLEWLRA